MNRQYQKNRLLCERWLYNDLLVSQTLVNNANCKPLKIANVTGRAEVLL